jgi:hypothetical protein
MTRRQLFEIVGNPPTVFPVAQLLFDWCLHFCQINSSSSVPRGFGDERHAFITS